MKPMSLGRQFTLLIAVFAIAMPLTVFGLAYLLNSDAASTKQLFAEGDRKSSALFALVDSIGRAQSTVQRLLREKDPDEIEKLMAQEKAASDKAREDIRAAGAANGAVERAFTALGGANQKSQALLLQGEAAQAQETFVAESNPAFETLLEAIGALQQEENRLSDVATAASEARSSRIRAGVYGFVGLLVVGLSVAGLLLVRHVNARLLRVVEELTQISSGTAAAASRISEASQALAQGATEQAASLEETSASSEEISSVTQHNADNSRQAVEQMANAAASIEAANSRLEQMTGSMTEILASSNKVSKIIRTIDEIAFQTNILALNAAVEAARAGESGMGFAVVADEVRNLAQRSAEAARNTAALIEESIAKSKEGKSRVDEMAEAIASVTENASQVSALVEAIRTSSEEQAQGIAQMSRTLAQVQQVTQSTAASAEENAAAGEELHAQTETMNATVRVLAGMVGQTAAAEAVQVSAESARSRRSLSGGRWT